MPRRPFISCGSLRALTLASLSTVLIASMAGTAFAAPKTDAVSPHGFATSPDAAPLNELDKASISQRVTRIATELDAAFLVAKISSATEARIVPSASTPQQAAKLLRKDLGLGEAAASEVALEAQDAVLDRAALQEGGTTITRSSVEVKNLEFQSMAGTIAQTTVNVYVRRQMSNSPVPWEEVIPYVIRYNTETKNIENLDIRNDLDSMDAASQGQLGAAPSLTENAVLGSAAAPTGLGASSTSSVNAADFSASAASIGASGKERAAAYADRY